MRLKFVFFSLSLSLSFFRAFWSILEHTKVHTVEVAHWKLCSSKNICCYISAQISIGGECWSSANGVAAGGCTSGTQCGPWLPDGGAWDGSSPWYCLATPRLTSGATCDYATKVSVICYNCCLEEQNRIIHLEWPLRHWSDLLQWCLCQHL